MESLQEDKEKLKQFKENLVEHLSKYVQILVLRPKMTSGLDSYFEGDFDFLISDEHFNKAINLIYDFCKEEGVNFILNQRAVNKKLFKFFISDVSAACLTIEFWISIEFSEKNKKYSFPASSIFKVMNERETVRTEVLALIYITHLYHKNKDIFSEENKFRFNWFISKLKHERSGDSSAMELLEELRSKKISIENANRRAIHLLKSFNIKNRSSFTEKVKLFWKKFKIKFISIKKIVPVVGPDGVGKGVVSDNTLIKLGRYEAFRFKALYRIRWIYKLRLILLKGYNKEPKNKLDEKICYYIFFVSLFTFQLLRYFKKDRVILMDRYFIDYFATPIRYLEGERPKKLFLYNFLLSLSPTPNKMIFLGCKNQSLIDRKNELSLISIEFLQKINCDFILKKDLPEILFISTENPINTSSKVMMEFLKEHESNLKKLNSLS